MGKIFGISSLPVSTPTTPFNPVVMPTQTVREIKKPYNTSIISNNIKPKTTPKNTMHPINRLIRYCIRKIIK